MGLWPLVANATRGPAPEDVYALRLYTPGDNRQARAL